MRTQIALSALLLLQVLSQGYVDAKKKESTVTKAQGPPPFFLQDPTDSLCLGGDEFKRCSIDALFFVVGKPGKYQIHKRPVDENNASDDGICITKPSCSEKDNKKIQDVKLAKCTHCGAKNWNILGDSKTGYVITEGEGENKVCVVREKGSKKVKVAPCDSDEVAYTPLQLQFASSADITAMSSNGARFIGAASDGDKKIVQSFLKGKEVDVNERDWDDLTALITASSAGHLDIVKILLKAGADVNASDKDGITALMEASIMGHEKIVNTLIDAGAEIDFKSNSGVTALWLAAGENRIGVMKNLLKKNADASVTRSDGITALMTASVAGHVDTIKLLLEDGADPLAVDADGLTALMNAAEKGATDVMKVLIDAAESDDYVNMMSTTGFNALIIASAHGHSDAVKYLITETNADVNLVHDNQVTALMYASASGHVETMKILLEDGKVDINALHTNGGSALVEACTAGASDAITFLIESGAKYNIVDNDGVTPLMAIAAQGDIVGVNTVVDALKKDLNAAQLKDHINSFSFSGGSAVMFAAAGGHSEATKTLTELGADVNAVAQATPEYLEKLAVMIEEGTVDDNDPHVDGVTAVHVAAQGGHLECINILIEAGATVTIEDDEDRTALLLAVKGNFGDVAIALVKGGADPNTPYIDEEGASHNLLFDSLVVENKEFAALLIESGADIYSEDEHKVTSLLQASHRGMTDVVKALLSKNTKEGWVDTASDENITPLIAASAEGHLEIVQMLIDVAANVISKDKDQTSSLMAAAARGHTDIVEALLKAGASVNEQNVDGHTALMFAYNGKNQVETLWERYEQFVQESEVESKGEAVDDGGTGPIIREALANHNRMVSLLIKNGADESIKDKEGHTALDFDYHPDADADVLKQEEQAGKKRDASKNEL
jgi:ankyrin repeat protein